MKPRSHQIDYVPVDACSNHVPTDDHYGAAAPEA